MDELVVFNFEDELEKAGYLFAFEYGDYGFSWDITRVYTKGGRVFDLYDSGCSCNDFGDGWYDIDTVIGEMRQVTKLSDVEDLDLKESYRKFGVV